MTCKTAYPYTTGTPVGSGTATGYDYANNWKDKLIAVGSTSLTYDLIGNLTNDGNWDYAWEAGRQLKRQVKAQGSSVGYGSVEYEYDHTGMRARKTVRDLNGIIDSVYDYTYNGKMLTHLTCGNDSLHFFYDAQARPAMVNWNGTNYHYLYDLQSDVIGLVDTNGSVVVEYKYDAWGRIIGSTGSLAATLGKLNPFRYRGYVYDEETQMYYCRSRYYCPNLHRWISTDTLDGSIGSILSQNKYAYCLNCPVVVSDPDGFWGVLAVVSAVFVASAAFVAATVVTAAVVAVEIVVEEAKQAIQNSVGFAFRSAALLYLLSGIPLISRLTTRSREATVASIEQATEKGDYKAKSNPHPVEYRATVYVNIGLIEGHEHGTYIPTRPISFQYAIPYVRNGGSVIATSRRNAIKLAVAVGNGKAISRHDKHRNQYTGISVGFRRHYHAGINEHIGGHIFYVG